VRTILLSLIPTIVLSGAVAAQSSKAAAPSRLLTETEEIALAQSAAPAAMSVVADIYVLGRRVRTGTNGMACLVTRDHPESLYPICYDREATRTVLPLMLERQKLLQAGMSAEAATKEIERRVERGELPKPTRGAIAYIMSAQQVIYASPEGPRVGQWYPHIMVYYPFATAADLVIPQGTDFGVAQAGTLTAHLLVKVRDWSGKE